MGLMGTRSMTKAAGESGLHWARRILYGHGDVEFPSQEQYDAAQAFIDETANSNSGPNKSQQALLRRLANGTPDLALAKSVVQPLVEDRSREADAALRFKLSQVL